MKKGLLICNAGMSSMMVAKEVEKKMGGKMKWHAMGISGSDDYHNVVDDYDFIFVSPQIRFMFDEIRSITKKTTPVVQIQPQQYIVLKAQELADVVEKAMKDKK